MNPKKNKHTILRFFDFSIFQNQFVLRNLINKNESLNLQETLLLFFVLLKLKSLLNDLQIKKNNIYCVIKDFCMLRNIIKNKRKDQFNHNILSIKDTHEQI